MRIVNWNVERPAISSPKNAMRIQHLLNLQPDIVVLTETSKSVDLSPNFSGRFCSPSPRKPREGEAVAAIWVRNDRFKVIQPIQTADPREAVCVELESKGQHYIVYGSIIPYHGAKGADGKSTRWQEHKHTIRWHRSDWQKLRSQYPEHHLIAAGDYNQHRDGVGKYGTIEVRRLLTDALHICNLNCVTEQDFVATTGLSRRNLDHICLTDKLAGAVTDVLAWEGTINGTRLSDHNGITVELDDTAIAG
ncbi:endonuclease/exonuclease/phosphatase family protein [filamentous cyanobacterium LEGE 11480]|uniref:Endonuclease/exonuclease/phosphatase family protein n=1 Tax=Romeriopsis navalis LEGE 11480 TaxID=2777977 RepID=A0A928VMU6_9CYAN|nr:endonuclease/exonuclease/phosphatase family protein [Romeriopsis navalis]MBE9029302.1 endonuclease/exonuclease/phosphatase family protein [Romeriopsis navalis LEGE 11480]